MPSEMEVKAEMENFPAEQKVPSVFYRKNGKPVRKPRPIVYQIYLCCKCVENNTDEKMKDLLKSEGMDETKIVGAWSADIFRPPQDTTNQHKRSSYSVSSLEQAEDHIQIRLAALKEIFHWITADVDQSMWPRISASIVSNDVFLVNLLREWLPKWHIQNYKIGKTDEYERPNAEMLREIGNISTKIKLNSSWQVDTAHEMMAVNDAVVKLLQKFEKNEV